MKWVGREKQARREWRRKHAKRIAHLDRMWRKANPDKVRQYDRKYKKNHPEKVRLWKRIWRKRNPEKVRMYCQRNAVSSRHKGFTLEKKRILLKQQNNRCLGCNRRILKIEDAKIDHNHRCCPPHRSCPKCRRGLLCMPCNMSIGLLKESVETLRRLATYLER